MMYTVYTVVPSNKAILFARQGFWSHEVGWPAREGPLYGDMLLICRIKDILKGFARIVYLSEHTLKTQNG